MAPVERDQGVEENEIKAQGDEEWEEDGLLHEHVSLC